jgi:glucose/arabinose dehydrogenase
MKSAQSKKLKSGQVTKKPSYGYGVEQVGSNCVVRFAPFKSRSQHSILWWKFMILLVFNLTGMIPTGFTASPVARLNGLPDALTPSLYQLEKAFKVPQLGLTRLSYMAGEENVYFATSKGGMIYSFNELENPTFQVVLNLTDVTFSRGGESGLMSLAVHPNFEENGHFFIFYTTLIETDEGTEEYDRLSRFTTTNGKFVKVDRSTEVILFQQLRQISLHHGGDLKFGPDGYLYVSLGDASRLTDEEENSQKIDSDFHAGILRIDVDGRDTNLEPNPHPGVMGSYWIPNDNPFINASEFNGVPIDTTQLRSEFYAVGLRNPWAISFDPETDELFAIDTGQSAFEEVNRINKGANYGWSFVEGDRIHHFKRKDFVDYNGFKKPILK